MSENEKCQFWYLKVCSQCIFYTLYISIGESGCIQINGRTFRITLSTVCVWCENVKKVERATNRKWLFVAKSGCEKDGLGGGNTQNTLLVLFQSEKTPTGRTKSGLHCRLCESLVVLVIWCSGTVAVCKKGRSGGGVGGWWLEGAGWRRDEMAPHYTLNVVIISKIQFGV